MKFFRAILPLIILLTGCVSINSPSQPTEEVISSQVPEQTTAVPTSTMILSATPVMLTLLPSVTPTPTQSLSYLVDSLDEKSYIIYEHGDDLDNKIYGISPLKGEPFLLLENQSIFSVSANGRFIAHQDDNSTDLTVLDLHNNKLTVVENQYECTTFAISSNGQWLACQVKYDLFVMSMQEGQWKQLVPRSDGGNYEWRAPRFSPNDQYLAYFNGYDSLDVDRYGLYITNSSCLVSLNTCEQYTKRIFTHATLSFGSSSGFSWSPDSQLLALPFTKRIQVINSNGDALMDIPVNSSFPESISWSPDGNRITYDGDDACIFLMHSQGGESTCLVQEYPHVMLILGWLALPDFVFQTGEKYKITPKGDNINLRTEPSLNAQVLRKIRTKEVVTLLDGPRYEDGYTWWQVQTEDNLIGWAVENSEWYEPVK